MTDTKPVILSRSVAQNTQSLRFLVWATESYQIQDGQRSQTGSNPPPNRRFEVM